MSKQKLNRPQVAGLLVNLSWFCPPRRDMRPLPKPTRKEVSSAPGTKAGKPILNRCACLLGNFELNRPTCFLLNHRRSVSHPAADTHVIGLQPDETQPLSLLSIARLNSAR